VVLVIRWTGLGGSAVAGGANKARNIPDVALMICWSTAPKLIRWANDAKRTLSAAEDRQDKHRPF
jgi:hypothetical protein